MNQQKEDVRYQQAERVGEAAHAQAPEMRRAIRVRSACDPAAIRCAIRVRSALRGGAIWHIWYIRNIRKICNCIYKCP